MPTPFVAVSLKLYFDHAETLRWSRRVAALARAHVAVVSGAIELAILPSTPSLSEVRRLVAGSAVRLGAQDLSCFDTGPYTGEASGRQLREVGCRYAEIGHAERRRLFGDDEERIRGKTAAALRNGLVPLLCVGEDMRGSPAAAAEQAVDQLRSALAGASGTTGLPEVVVAYEPVWAIGAAQPAPAEHIRTVCAALAAELGDHGDRTSRVIYGGSAGPGLLDELGAEVDGLFLGRRAHDVDGLAAVLDEAAARPAGEQPPS